MELLHAIIYTTRYIFKNGNLDWYYFISILSLFYLIKIKVIKKYTPLLIVFSVLLIFIETSSLLFTDLLHPIKSPIFTVLKLILCLVLLIATKEYFNHINLQHFIYWTASIQLVETMIALFTITDTFWKLNDVENGFYETRLQLLYMEPSELSMCSAIGMILIVISVLKYGFKMPYVLCAGVFLWDMYLSAGMCGILSLGIAIALVTFYKTIEIVIIQRKYFLLSLPVVLVTSGWLLIYKTNLLMVQRIRLILSGEMFADSSTTWRLLIPLRGIIPILKETHWMGVGLGNFNEDHMIPFIEKTVQTRAWFPNSFLYFIAEGGWIAIAIIIMGIMYLGYRSYLSDHIGILLLFIFIIVYQIPGGYFTNPLNWICYGIILAAPQKKTSFLSFYGLKRKESIDSQLPLE